MFTFLLLALAVAQPFDLSEKVAQIDIETATFDDILRVFGEPQGYLWGNNTFTRENLPQLFLADYPGGFRVMIRNRAAQELRFEGPGYRHASGLELGWTLDQALAVLPPPRLVVTGVANNAINGVLYRDINRTSGWHYYSVRDLKLRVFFWANKVSAIYITRSSMWGPDDLSLVSKPELQKYDDVRPFPGKVDISHMDLRDKADVIPTLWFNQKTVWPDQMPPGVDPDAILKAAMNPGLGVRALHAEGLDGTGISVGIIDQPMLLDHWEYTAKIGDYISFDRESASSMHGPAVASILAGTLTGVAPGATLYFAGHTGGGDAGGFTYGLQWMLEHNRKLPPEKRIRVVSVSAAPSGPGTPFLYNTDLWDKAVEAAEREGVVVLDCTGHRGIVHTAWLKGPDREDPASWAPGFPSDPPSSWPNHILAPASPRTTAEQYVPGDHSFQYTGQGGRSWAVPYIAGVLALGWQARPDLSGPQMIKLLFDSAYRTPDGSPVVNPREFIRLVRAVK